MRTFVVINPVVNLRSSPELSLTNDYSHQEGRETQLLLDENLILLEERGEWLKVGAREQLRYTEQEGWHPYHGWVHCSEVQEAPPTHYTHVICSPGSLSYGTHHVSEGRPIPTTPNREQLVNEARQFVGAPYLWGGRASPLPHTVASVDCSGLVNLLYRAQGLDIPRDAHDQYLMSHPTDSLQPGDPLYLAKTARINHVILKLDETTFIEAPETGKTVRILNWGTDIYEQEGKIKIFDRPHLYTAYLRTFLV